ncbi:APC family permease [Thiolapillus sp.]
MQTSSNLNRSLSLPLVVLYGMGTILGAGIYVLIGEVAGVAGYRAPLAFLVAALLAGFSAFSYAELSSRFPQSAGEAVYVQKGIGWRWLAILTGLMVIAMGVLSSATIANGFVGYLHVFVQIPGPLAVTLLIITLGLVAWWGIHQSVLLAGLFTLIEVFGLLLIIWVSRERFDQLPSLWNEIGFGGKGSFFPGVLLGAFLAFYAFIGFEDIVNVAEEVKRPRRTLPRAIILVLILTTLLYMSVSLIAVLSVPPAELAAQGAPLAHIYATNTGGKPVVITLVGMFAVINGALIQIIMASRILYGMSRQGWLPAVLGAVHPTTRTPHMATLLITITILIFALWLPLVTLAQFTSFFTLLVFSLVNIALIRLKLGGASPEGAVCIPLWAPVAGLIANVSIIVYQVLESG